MMVGRGGRPQTLRSGAAIATLLGLLVGACGGGPAASAPASAAPTGAAGPPATSAPTTPPAATAPPLAPSGGGILSGIVGSPPPPSGITWSRVADDAGSFSFEVPSAWGQARTVAWEENGSRIGTIVVAAPSLDAFGSDFSKPGVAVGVAANAGGLTLRASVESNDFSGACTATPTEESTEGGYGAAFRLWTGCGGLEESFVAVIAVAATDGTGLIAAILQGTSEAELGYLVPIVDSLQAAGVAPGLPTATPTAPGGVGPGYTVTIDECLLQIGDAIAIGRVRNGDTTGHAYRIAVRFSDEAGVLVGEDHRETPALTPGQAYRYQARWQAQGATAVTCVVSEVVVIE
jgi:hypothetical protein